eukprot:NODE_1033_length_2526_cov_1.012361.p1 type:complete len:258 gc:universal NODE_1033_length_2526_cov_1.012361:979-1752(+)
MNILILFSIYAMNLHHPKSNYPFKITKLLGKGTGGKVYSGFYQNIPVAIKQNLQLNDLKSHKSFKNYTSKQLKSFIPINYNQLIQESKYLYQLQSPFIVKIYNVYRSPSSISLILEQCKPSNKHRELNIYQYIHDIVNALSFIHSKYICHLDIKPDNIMNCHGTYKLLDLGMMHSRCSHLYDYTGTDGYAAPEIIKHQKYPYNGYSTDIYAFGMTIKYYYKTEMYRNKIIEQMIECMTRQKHRCDLKKVRQLSMELK